MKKQLHLLVPLFLLIINCSFKADDPIVPSPEPDQEVILQTIRKGQQKTFQAKDLKPGLEATFYEWKADHGVIISQQGRRLIFQAPDFAGKVKLECRQMHEERLLGTTRYEIQVYSQAVVLKADDLVYESGSIFPANWNKYFELIEELNIKGSAGIIGNSLEKAPASYFEKIKKHHRKGNIEFWNHGYTHGLGLRNNKGEVYHEFYNSGRDFQKVHMERTQTLGKEKLSITFRAFGAPGNQFDEDTNSLIEENQDIRLWFFGHPGSHKNVLKRTPGCEIEFPVHFPVYQKFLDNYKPDTEIMVLQFHPTRWSAEQFEEFRKIIHHLQNLKVCFMNPVDVAGEFYPELLEGTEEFISLL